MVKRIYIAEVSFSICIKKSSILHLRVVYIFQVQVILLLSPETEEEAMVTTY